MINKKLILVFLITFVIISSLITLFLASKNEEDVQTELTLLEPENQKTLLPSSSNNNENILTEKYFSDTKNHQENSKVKLISDDKQENLKINSSLEEPEKIFKRAGEEYILREGEEYVLIGIEFSPSLPSKICAGNSGNELIDITVKGSVLIVWGYRWACAFPGGDNYDLKLRLMESDSLSGDDTIAEQYLYIHKQCEDTDDFYVSFSKTFKNVDLSSQFGGAEDIWTIEVYTIIEPRDKKTIAASTKNYDIGKVDCDCLSGPCCDLSNRPYKLKSSGSQPTNYTDEYFCSGTNSATGTSYTNLRDYYCDGKSSSVKSKDSSKNTCGTCKYCEASFLSCKNYDISTSCGTSMHCDGAGTCVTCKSQDHSACYDNDIYWFNECGNMETKKTECGDSGYSGNNYCYNDDVYRDYVTKGCSSNSCSSSTTKEKQTECQYGCENGKCKPNPRECEKDSDCPGDSQLGDPFCSEGNLYRIYRDYFCAKNPETSRCTYADTNKIYSNCQYGCTNGQCNAAPPPKQPDLTVEDLIVQSIIGREVVLGFTIKNIGEVVSDSVYWMVNTNSSDKNPKRTNPVVLTPGNFTRAFMILNYSTSGSYKPKVIVDPDNIVKESNENNNEQSISVSV